MCVESADISDWYGRSPGFVACRMPVCVFSCPARGARVFRLAGTRGSNSTDVFETASCGGRKTKAGPPRPVLLDPDLSRALGTARDEPGLQRSGRDGTACSSAKTSL